MELIDKVALIAEIERLKDEYLKHSRNKFHAKWSCGTLDNILSFLDTIEVKEKPVSEDLEEAAKDYSNNLDNIYGSMGEQTRNAFKAGAKWKEQQMMSKAVNGVEINSRRSDGRCILSGNFSKIRHR
jgi:hypothetical protein